MNSKDFEDFCAELEWQGHVCEVNNELALYRNTGDARFFWRAYLLVREKGNPVPEQFLTKIDEYAGAMLKAQSPNEIAAGLNLIGDKKSHVGPKQSQAYRKRWRLASEVQLVMNALPRINLKQAIEIVARNRGVTPSKVKSDYHKVFTAPLKRQDGVQKNEGRTNLEAAMRRWG